MTDDLRAYALELVHQASQPTGRVGSGEGEALCAGRCTTCGRRGHDHFSCPGVNLEEPLDRRLETFDDEPLGSPWGDR